MEIDLQSVVEQLLEEVKRLTFENAALRSLIGNQTEENSEVTEAAGDDGES